MQSRVVTSKDTSGQTASSGSGPLTGTTSSASPKSALRGMGYEEGAAALAPPPDSGPGAGRSGAPIQMRSRKDLKSAAPGTRDVDTSMFGQGADMRYDPDWRLIIGGIQPTDVVQGKIGDCYLMAALAAVAQSNPSIIKSMVEVIPGAPGAIPIFKVRFFRPSGQGFSAEWIRVSGTLPVEISANKKEGYNFLAHGHTGKTTVGREIWPAVVEKAYTLFKANTKDPGKASYKSIEGGDGGMAMSHITGASSKAAALDGPGAELIGVFDQMLHAFKAGQAMTASSYPPEEAPEWKNLWGLWAEKGMKYGKEVGNESMAQMANTHAYAITGVRTSPNKQVQITNPWGDLCDWLAWPKFCELFRAVKINGKQRTTR